MKKLPICTTEAVFVATATVGKPQVQSAANRLLGGNHNWVKRVTSGIALTGLPRRGIYTSIGVH